MAPKKGQKMSLNEFLGDAVSGSWADEMDSLPSAPAFRSDEERARGGDRFSSRKDDFLSSRPDRAQLPPREDVPLPTQPPFTAFIGNLAFDLTESELEDHFGPHQTNSVKIIKDRDDKPKGFGYIEFANIDGLKDALDKNGSTLSHRTIRVSVAEPPKERSGFVGGPDDDGKFANNWRRDGPLPDRPDLPDSRDSSRRRFDGLGNPDRSGPSVSENASDWRSNKPTGRLSSTDTESLSSKRKGPGFLTPDSSASIADKEEVWTIGSKFKPSATGSTPDDGVGSKYGGFRGLTEQSKDVPSVPDEGDWRSSRLKASARNNTSPSNSTPPTPQMSRRKLELLPRSASTSTSPSPLSSPKLPSTASGSSRSNPFGNARPVDVSSREREVSERLERDRVHHSMSRTSSRTASERTRTKTPPPVSFDTSTPPIPKSPSSSHHSSLSSNVRPSVSFASAASLRKDESSDTK